MFVFTRRATVAAIAVLGLGLSTVPALTASATNAGSKSGDNTVGCAVNWQAHTIMDIDGAPDVPADLLVNLEGTPVDYSNGGFATEVSPALGGTPGRFEIQHWISGDTINWRVFVATDHPLAGTEITLGLPEVASEYSVSDATEWGVNGYNVATGGPWVNGHTYTSATPGKVVVGDIPAFSQTVIMYSAKLAPGTEHNTYEATANLTARLTQGAGCEPTLPPVPQVPAEGKCEQKLVGRTVMPVPARDITVRDKSGDGGEVNADGWGVGATRTFRLYGATDKPLTDVTFYARPAQGLAFKDAAVVNTPGYGQLKANGYTAAVSGAGTPVILDDGTVMVTIAEMPAKSSFSFNITGVLDGSGKVMVIDEMMAGTLAQCEPAPGNGPTPTQSPTPTTTPTTAPTTTPAPTTTTTPHPGAPVTTQPAPPPATVAPKPTVTVTAQPTTPPVAPPTATSEPTPVAPTQPTKPAAPVVPAVPVKPAKPAKPAQKMVTRTFQVDRYMPRTAAQARLVARLDDDRVLRYREDKPMWGKARWQFVTVRVAADATTAEVMKAINAKTSARIGDVRTTAALRSAKPGQSYVVAWELGRGATVKAPWGSSHKVNQKFFARA